MSIRVAIATLGCKVNQYDTATIETAVRQQGGEIVGFDAAADVYVVNTCTVTDRADAESRQLARRARRLSPSARIVMTGCFAQVNPNGAALPEVDHVVGLNRLPEILSAVQGSLSGRIHVEDLRTARRVRTLGAETFTGQTRAFLKVQEGCNLFCTFCIVPFSRGASRSVPPREVLAQLDRLAELGFQEVVLTGVHLGGYGADLSPRLELSDLVEMILERGGMSRIRISSIDPPEVTPRLLRLFAAGGALCPHFHIPVQAADDAVLAQMRRKYDSSFLSDLTMQIRDMVPSAAIGTDVIAGFPGETESQFAAGLQRLAELPFTYFHVFPYSKRSGTTAARRSDHLPASVVRQRAARLRQLGEAKRSAFAAQFVGRTMAVLVEEALPSGTEWSGYTRNYQRVRLHGGEALANREVLMEVSSVSSAVLVGRWVAELA